MNNDFYEDLEDMMFEDETDDNLDTLISSSIEDQFPEWLITQMKVADSQKKQNSKINNRFKDQEKESSLKYKYIELFLDQPCFDVNARVFEKGETVLEKACLMKFPGLVKMILEHEDVEFNCKNFHDETVAHHAVRGGCPEVIELLAKVPEVDWNIKNILGETPIFLAIDELKFECFEQLAKIKSLDWNVLNRQKNTPLLQNSFWIAHKDNEAKKRNKLLEFVIDNPNIDWNIKAKNDDTLLLREVRNSNYEALKTLLQNPKVDWNIHQDGGESPVVMIMFKRDKQEEKIEMLKLLAKAPHVDWNLVGLRYNFGKVSWNVGFVYPACIAALLEDRQILEIMADIPSLDWNAKVGFPEKDQNVLILALQSECYEFLKFFFTLPNIEYNVHDLPRCKGKDCKKNCNKNIIPRKVFENCIEICIEEQERTGYNYSDVMDYLKEAITHTKQIYRQKIKFHK